MREDILSMAGEGLASWLSSLGQPAYRARQVFSWLHQRGAASFSQMTDLPRALRETLEEHCYIEAPAVARRQRSADGTQKFLFSLRDGNCVEAVWMEYHHGSTVCISTQVGCRMGCKFCASTLGGLVRGLTAGEMLGEVYALERAVGKRVGGVVLMGIGEPLDNLENVARFLTLLSDPRGRALSLRHVSLSTCGVVPGIDRLAEYGFPLTLSVSLHAPDDETRDKIMPINRRYPLPALMGACERYFERTGRRISFEYALISGTNDSPAHAHRLIALLGALRAGGERMPVHVNLIPVNEVRGRGCRRGSKASVAAFQAALQRGGINATVRRELGGDISAACGQLRREHAAQSSAGAAGAPAGKEGTKGA